MTAKKMDINELRRLVKEGESVNLEFKEAAKRGGEQDKIGQELCSFACSAGGTLLVGVSDDGKILGVENAPKAQGQLLSRIYDSTEPPLAPEVELIDIKGNKTVIRLKVEGTPENVYTYKGVAYVRVNDRTVRMNQREYQRRVRQHHPESWEMVPVSDATEKDIDFEAVEDYIKRYEHWNRTKLNLSPKELLLTRHLVVKKGKTLQPTRAGIILFGKDPRQFFLKAYVTVARFPGTEVGHDILDMKDLAGPLVPVVDKATAYLREHSGRLTRPTKDKPTTENIPQYPEWPLRELVVNAVVHRDYSVTGGRVLIKMFKDRVTFRSPGGFPMGISEENVLTAQRTRNPLIAKMLHDLGYIEEFGEGLDRVFEEIREHPLEASEPKIEEVAGDVVVTIYSPKEFLVSEAKLPVVDLNKRQKRALAYVHQEGRIDNSEYQELTGVTRKTATRDLQDLVEKGYLLQKGERRGVHYVLP